MVVVDYPDSTCRKFFMHEYLLFGPIDSNCSYSAFQVELPLEGERFETKKGIYGENDIVHSTFYGRIYYYPVLADCAPLPIAEYPRKLRVPITESPGYVDALCGFACPNVGMLTATLATQYSQYAIDRIDANWQITRLIAWKSTPGRCYVYKTSITLTGWTSSTQVRADVLTQSSIYPVEAPFDCSREASYEQIKSLEGLVTKWSPVSRTIKSFPVYTSKPSGTLSPAKLAQNLEIFADSVMMSDFQIPLKDYGDLAANAVNQRKRIDTNMLAFLRDIPNSKDLIPRLKNLLSLKTHAGNYLAVNYGILPTIDDCKKIIGAFKDRIPYLDKYGHEILRASHTEKLDTGETTYELSQYVKVAVANEDSEFLRLCEEIDEYGMMPTSENLYDLVKFSFVLDWFIDVGGFLERIDQNQRLLRCNIPYVTLSDKRSVTGVLRQNPALPLLGPVRWSYYHRWVQSQCPLPPITLSLTPTTSNHWLEAGALLIQLAH